MVTLPVPRPLIVTRLKKIEGQIRGLQKMVTEERECMDIITQLAASKAALESVAASVLRNYAVICAQKKGTDVGLELARAVSVWIGGHAD